jgi:hypothetical protein
MNIAPISETVRDYLKGVEAMVEANSYEKHHLWMDFSKQSKEAGYGRAADSILFDWGSVGMGYFACVGKFADQPVMVSLLIDIIDGHRVLFWYVSGTYADHDLADAWLAENVPNSHIRGDANGFINVMQRLNRDS